MPPLVFGLSFCRGVAKNAVNDRDFDFSFPGKTKKNRKKKSFLRVIVQEIRRGRGYPFGKKNPNFHKFHVYFHKSQNVKKHGEK